MARLIQKSGYFKGGSGVGYMRYVAQREGVEITSDTGPVTQTQQKLIAKIQKDFPDTKDSFEYEDYLTTPNRATASAYIAAALDSHLHEMEPESGYMKYIAQRPRAEKHGGHGLFSAAPATDLDEAVNFCILLQKEPVSLNELDVEQTLARLAAKEEQGVTFVDIEQVDRKAERIKGALVGAGLFTAIMLLTIGIMAWSFCVDPQDVPPLPLLVVLFGIPAACIIGTLKVLVDRLKEIGKGEEDAYRNY